MKFYVAVLDSNCEPHYFQHKENAAKYLIQNCILSNCELDEANDSGELWNEAGESVGYYYSPEIED